MVQKHIGHISMHYDVNPKVPKALATWHCDLELGEFGWEVMWAHPDNSTVVIFMEPGVHHIYLQVGGEFQQFHPNLAAAYDAAEAMEASLKPFEMPEVTS